MSSAVSLVPRLRVAQLSCTYASTRGEVAALRDVSFEVRAGARLAIVGESGAGKSTLLRCLNLLVRPTAGAVELDGAALTALDPSALAAARRQLGMVFQHFALLQRRTVRDNVALPLELSGLPPAHVEARVDAVLARVRLTELARAYPSELSGGQRQRVGIARALVHRPRVLLCDEPTSALDAQTARHIVGLLAELAAELQLTVVFVSHQLEVVRALADEVLVLHGGRLQERSPVEAFFRAPASAAGQRLFREQDGEVRDVSGVA